MCIAYTSKSKKGSLKASLDGGEYEIRTREGVNPTRFPSVRHRPLGEFSIMLSKDNCVIITSISLLCQFINDVGVLCSMNCKDTAMERYMNCKVDVRARGFPDTLGYMFVFACCYASR